MKYDWRDDTNAIPIFYVLQILLDSLFDLLCAVANQRTIRILGWLCAGGNICRILAAISDCVECGMAGSIVALYLGAGQEAQAIRFEYDILGHQKLLATVPLSAAIRLSNWWIRQLRYVLLFMRNLKDFYVFKKAIKCLPRFGRHVYELCKRWNEYTRTRARSRLPRIRNSYSFNWERRRMIEFLMRLVELSHVCRETRFSAGALNRLHQFWNGLCTLHVARSLVDFTRDMIVSSFARRRFFYDQILFLRFLLFWINPKQIIKINIYGTSHNIWIRPALTRSRVYLRKFTPNRSKLVHDWPFRPRTNWIWWAFDIWILLFEICFDYTNNICPFFIGLLWQVLEWQPHWSAYLPHWAWRPNWKQWPLNL